MKHSKILKIDRKRFDALAGPSRSPAAEFISEELAWFSNEEETILGVVLADIIDKDFACVIMGRDEGKRFRAIDVQASIETLDSAIEWLHEYISQKTLTNQKVFPQGDENLGVDLFTQVVTEAKLHPLFKFLIEEDFFIPAKSIINELMNHFVDIDGNFVEQFQSTGFEARLWELYLNTYLTEEPLFFDREYDRPYFIVEKYGHQVAIEAVIVGRSKDNPVREPTVEPKTLTLEEIREKQAHEMPIKFGSPLYSKLKKLYWELKHVVDRPLIFAIADFHDDQSMLWSSTSLINYLYGVKHDFEYDENEQLLISALKIEHHQVGNKKIPSGYFFQPDAEHVSAVMFSASGTITKFNRLGKQAGFGLSNILMWRYGICHDHNPNASMPKQFKYQVTANCEETWAEGLSMYHNPKAKIPVPRELFPSIAHHYFEDGQIISELPEFYPYSSFTMNTKIVP